MAKIVATVLASLLVPAAVALAGDAAGGIGPKRVHANPTPEYRIGRALARLTGKPYNGQPPLVPIATEALAREFPHYRFYGLTFPQWPLAEVPPHPLSASNVVSLAPGGAVMVLTSPSELKDYFNGHRHRAARDPGTILLAWLDLTWVFSEDGFFQFDVGQAIQVNRQDENVLASGKDIVQPHGGDQGEIDVALTIAPDGTILSAQDTRDVRAGIRPICQATKLLDPDPIVRKMAEQCLLVMGSRAKPYLDAQRAKSPPELQKAIDAIWLRMQERERAMSSTGMPTTRRAN